MPLLLANTMKRELSFVVSTGPSHMLVDTLCSMLEGASIGLSIRQKEVEVDLLDTEQIEPSSSLLFSSKG